MSKNSIKIAIPEKAPIIPKPLKAPPPATIYLKYKKTSGKTLPKTENTISFLKTLKKNSVSENLKTVGNASKYQIYIFKIFALTFLTMGFLYNLLSYTYYTPEFFCNKNNIFLKCSQKEACLQGFLKR